MDKSDTSSKSIKSILDWKSRLPLEKRKIESKRIMAKYPDRLPVIVVVATVNSTNKPMVLLRNKYLAPSDTPIGHLFASIRKQTENLTPAEACTIFSGNSMLGTNLILSQCYKENKDEDGFLYLQISKEDAFG